MKTLHYFYPILLIATLVCLTPTWALGQSEKALYTFQGGIDGAFPYYGGVTFDAFGNLYGTTAGGGEWGWGTAFELSPDSSGSWTESVIHTFGSGNDGQQPLSGLIFAGGNLYGTTASGGSGYGTVFELVPIAGGGWAENILYSFKGAEDGFQPIGSLVFDAAGSLYGATTEGGAYYQDSWGGTVFELAKNTQGVWNKRVLHSFGSGNDGFFSWGNLTFDPAGNLYGTTELGGPHGMGTVFELAHVSGGAWAEHLLYGFKATNDGAEPTQGLTFDAAGNLYGTTFLGGSRSWGTVFKLSPASGEKWKEQILHDFATESGGINPSGNLLLDSAGNLYGGTFAGGTGEGCVHEGCGVVYELSPSLSGNWKETILMNSSVNLDGGVPWCGLTFDAAENLYGMTHGVSGTIAYYGTVFEVTR
jgi:uncharacterized repeat protein (TIGR03803 family)